MVEMRVNLMVPWPSENVNIFVIGLVCVGPVKLPGSDPRIFSAWCLGKIMSISK